MAWTHFSEPLADGVEPTMAQRGEVINALVERIQAVSTIGNSDNEWAVDLADAAAAKEQALQHFQLKVTRRGDDPFGGLQWMNLGQILMEISLWYSRDGLGRTRFLSSTSGGLDDSLAESLGTEFGISPAMARDVLQSGELNNALRWNLVWQGIQFLDAVVFGLPQPANAGDFAGMEFDAVPNFQRDTGDTNNITWPQVADLYYTTTESATASGSLLFIIQQAYRFDDSGTARGINGLRISGNYVNNPGFDFFDGADLRAWFQRFIGAIPFDGSEAAAATAKFLVGTEELSMNLGGDAGGAFFSVDGQTDKGQQQITGKFDAYDDSDFIGPFLPSSDPPQPVDTEQKGGQIALRNLTIRPDWTHKPIPPP